jgi:hypothetical protein
MAGAQLKSNCKTCFFVADEKDISLISHYEHQMKSAGLLCLSSNINWLDNAYNFRDCSVTTHVITRGVGLCEVDDTLL